MSERIIDVYINYQNKDIPIGVLYVDFVRNQEIHSFEFNPSYLKLDKRFIFDVNLSDNLGRQYAKTPNKTFSFINDVTPDRWGRMLINKYYRESGNNQHQLGESDYLLALDDETRLGALRFKLRKGQKEIKDFQKHIPTLLDLNRLANISYDITSITKDELSLLLAPGSSLGGARPKAAFYDKDKNLYLAKFPKKDDDYDVELWEKITNDLASLCHLNVAESKIYQLNKYGHAFLSKRFDRNKKERIPYLSLMSALGASDGESGQYSYLDFVDTIVSLSNQPKADLYELFKRIAFNIIVHNGDDHLRNHGFIYIAKGWRLAPLFDINISIEHQHLSLSIDGNNNDFSLSKLVDTANFYRLNKKDGETVINEMKKIIKLNLPLLAKKYHARENEIKMFTKIIDY